VAWVSPMDSALCLLSTICRTSAWDMGFKIQRWNTSFAWLL